MIHSKLAFFTTLFKTPHCDVPQIPNDCLEHVFNYLDDKTVAPRLVNSFWNDVYLRSDQHQAHIMAAQKNALYKSVMHLDQNLFNKCMLWNVPINSIYELAGNLIPDDEPNPNVKIHNANLLHILILHVFESIRESSNKVIQFTKLLLASGIDINHEAHVDFIIHYFDILSGTQSTEHYENQLSPIDFINEYFQHDLKWYDPKWCREISALLKIAKAEQELPQKLSQRHIDFFCEELILLCEVDKKTVVDYLIDLQVQQKGLRYEFKDNVVDAIFSLDSMRKLIRNPGCCRIL